MNKDTMDDFLSNNKNEFDERTPSAKIWSRIERTLFGSGSNISFWNSVSVWRAAAVMLFGLALFQFLNTKGPILNQQARMDLQDFVDVESYYAAQISEKVALISNEGLFEDDSFSQDVQKLEAMYAILAEDMKRHPSEKVKDAMVLNMLVRIDLLNQQIQKLEEKKRSKTAAT